MPAPPALPDSDPPPQFDYELADSLPLEVIIASSANSASNVMGAVAELWSILEELFIKTPAIFVNQQEFNKKEADILHLERKSGLEASAKATVAMAADAGTLPTANKSVKALVSQEVTISIYVDLKLLEKFPVGNIVNFHSDQ
jgi:ApbE superfamily uncharacterized protein (UPF0280 family)